MTDQTPLLISDKDCRMALRITMALAIKGLSFKTSPLRDLMKNEHPHMKTIALGFPILLIGREGAAGWVAPLDILEKTTPSPSLFPNGNCGMPIALSYWSDHAAAKASHGVKFAPYAELIARQIADGRPFLQGDAPGLADIESYVAVDGATEKDLPPQVSAWKTRIDTLKNSVSYQHVKTSEADHHLRAVKDIAVSSVDLDR